MPIEYEIIEISDSRCLNGRINLSNMIGSSAGGITVSLVAKNETKTLIAILCYLEAEIDYKLFFLFYNVVSHNYKQKILSPFDKKLRA